MKTRYLRMIKKQRGFTLIELLAVILILGIIALIAIPTVNSVVKQSRIGANESTANSLVNAAAQQCTIAQLNGEKVEGMFDLSNLYEYVKGNKDLTGYYKVDNNCNVELLMQSNDLLDYCYTKTLDGKVEYYELGESGTCLLEQKEVTEDSCFEYETNGNEITITGYKCGGTITDWSFLENPDLDTFDKSTISYDPGTNMDVVIPSYINGKKVTKIAESAFSNIEIADPNLPPSEENIKIVPNKNVIINSLVIPNTVKEIGDIAFSINDIKDITISYGVEKIGMAAFNFNLIKRLYIPDSVKSIGAWAFSNNNIESVVLSKSLKIIEYNTFSINKITGKLLIPDNVEKIVGGAFATNNIESLVLSKSLVTIEIAAFYNNKIIGTLVIPDSVKKIEQGAFSTNNIESLVLSKSLVTLERDAFYNNNIKGTLVIPDSVKTIGIGAFNKNNLEKVILGKSVETIDAAAFYMLKSDNSNINLTSIVNNSGRAFMWSNILYWYDNEYTIFETGEHVTPDQIRVYITKD